jgi:hypothetical protein
MSEPAVEKRPATEETAEERRAKKKKSRWGSEEEKIEIPGVITTLPSSLTKEQQECYLSMWCGCSVGSEFFRDSGKTHV